MKIERGALRVAHIKQLASLPYLTHLKLYQWSDHVNKWVPELVKLPNIQILDLSENNLSNEMFSELVTNMVSLRELIVNKCQLLTNAVKQDLIDNVIDRQLIVKAELTLLTSEPNNHISPNVILIL